MSELFFMGPLWRVFIYSDRQLAFSTTEQHNSDKQRVFLLGYI
jgi:hypothetical protein